MDYKKEKMIFEKTQDPILLALRALQPGGYLDVTMAPGRNGNQLQSRVRSWCNRGQLSGKFTRRRLDANVYRLIRIK